MDGVPDRLPDYARRAGAPSDLARPTRRPTDSVSHGVDKVRHAAGLTRRHRVPTRDLTLDPTDKRSDPASGSATRITRLASKPKTTTSNQVFPPEKEKEDQADAML